MALMHFTAADAVPNRWGTLGPYTARPAKDGCPDWPVWYVTNNGRTNVLSFPGCGGAVLTSRAVAEEIARRWNSLQPVQHRVEADTGGKQKG
jgi:hypothetical protein